MVGFFFPKKLAGAGSSLSLCCFVSWTDKGQDLGAGAPRAGLEAKCTCLIMEFKLGNVDLLRAAWSRVPGGA